MAEEPSRRDLFKIVGKAAAAGATPSTAIDAIFASFSSDEKRKSLLHVMNLLKQRSDFINYNGDKQTVYALYCEISRTRVAIEKKYWEPVDWDMSALNQQEAGKMSDELTLLQHQCKEKFGFFNQQIAAVDKEILHYPEEAEACIKWLEDRRSSFKPTNQDNKMFESFEEFRPKIAPSIYEDIKKLLVNNQSELLLREKKLVQKLLSDMQKTISSANIRIRGEHSPDWQRQRAQKVLECKNRDQDFLESIRSVFTTIQNYPEIYLESVLDRGYGDDRWIIRYAPNAPINASDNEISNYFDSLEYQLKQLSPNVTGELARATPREQGYGEYDYERIVITNPSFALREILKEAKTANLQRHLGQKRYSQAL